LSGRRNGRHHERQVVFDVWSNCRRDAHFSDRHGVDPKVRIPGFTWQLFQAESLAQ
jgi:hypothetical protein